MSNTIDIDGFSRLENVQCRLRQTLSLFNLVANNFYFQKKPDAETLAYNYDATSDIIHLLHELLFDQTAELEDILYGKKGGDNNG